MNSFRDDLLTILKRLKYKYDARYLIDKPEDDQHYPYLRIGFLEEEIKSYGIDINSIHLLHIAVAKLLEIPTDEILEWRWIDSFNEQKGEPYYVIEPDNYLVFTVTPNLETAIKLIESGNKTPAYFDEENSTLIINNNPFSISRKSDLSNPHYILKYIFSHDPKEEHFYSEMEDENIFGDHKKPETYYKALNTVKEKLREENGIDDFFKKLTTGNAGSVQINSKYL